MFTKTPIFIIFCFLPFLGLTQKFADKNYFLVDSLEIDKISESDKKLLDSCLTFFYQAKDDTTKLKGISTIIEESWDDNVWPKYNKWAFHFITEKLKENPNEKVKKHLTIRLAGTLNNIGYFFNSKGDVKNALTYYKKGLKIQLELDAKKGMATSYNNIGAILKQQGDIPTALEYYHKSLKIQEEIESVEAYLTLQKLRFKNRFDFEIKNEFSIHEALYIPSQLIQPFIENAIKHGINSIADKAWVKIHVSLEEGELYFTIENNKPKTENLPLKDQPGGIGIENTKRRLSILYPNSHELSIKENESTYFVSLKVKL